MGEICRACHVAILPVHRARAVAHHRATIASQFAQLAHTGWRHKTTAQQSMRQQLRDPLGVAHIGLATRHRFQMLRVDHHQLHLPFQYVIDRLPVHPGRFHRHLRAPFVNQPIQQRQQILCHRAKLANLFLPLTAQPPKPARRDRSLVHIQSTAPLIDNLHCPYLLSKRFVPRPKEYSS